MNNGSKSGHDLCPEKGYPGWQLSGDDITHYHRIGIALFATIRLTTQLDIVIEKHGDWPLAFIAPTREGA
jgi:hypothetical protein